MSLDKTDALLREALSTNEAPSEALLGRVRTQLSRQTDDAAQTVPRPAAPRMRAQRRLRIAALVAVLLLALGMTAYAVTSILSGSEISKIFGETTLSNAFSKTGIPVFAQKEAGGYRYTLTELVTGTDLTADIYKGDYPSNSRMYVALAIERIDGAPMTQDLTHDISPLLQGYEPWNWNVYTLNTWMQISVHEGVQYTILSCDDFSALADTGVKLIIGPKQKKGVFTECVSFDRETGDIALKPGYEDKAVLFDLPIPETYADAEKANEFLARVRATMSRETEQRTSIGMKKTNELFYMTGNSHNANVKEVRETAFWEDAKVLEETRHPFEALSNEQDKQDEHFVYLYRADPSVSGSELSVILPSNFKHTLEIECPPEQKIIARILVYDDVCKAVMLERDEKGFISSGVVLEKPLPKAEE